jgi:hypothetical protein
MSKPDYARLNEIKVDQKNLYREEVYTDLRFATIRQLTPVLPDGQKDDRRKTLFFGQTQMMSPAGAIPLQFSLEANNLKQAMEKFPQAVEKSVEEFVESAKEAKRQADSRIVVPGSEQGGKITLK